MGPIWGQMEEHSWQIGTKDETNRGWRQSSRVNHSGEVEAVGWGQVEPGEGTEPGNSGKTIKTS